MPDERNRCDPVLPGKPGGNLTGVTDERREIQVLFAKRWKHRGADAALVVTHRGDAGARQSLGDGFVGIRLEAAGIVAVAVSRSGSRDDDHRMPRRLVWKHQRRGKPRDIDVL
jgi:hypothetical protein